MRGALRLALALAMLAVSVAAIAGEPRVRARELGIAPGIFATGEHNAITDVAGVLVGQTTVREGDTIRTGVTAILPGVVRTELSAGSAVPGWSEGLTTVDPEDIAAEIVAAVGTTKMRAVCPKALSRTIKAVSLLPERGRLAFERITRFELAFTNADPATRAKYHERIVSNG